MKYHAQNTLYFRVLLPHYYRRLTNKPINNMELESTELSGKKSTMHKTYSFSLGMCVLTDSVL